MNVKRLPAAVATRALNAAAAVALLATGIDAAVADEAAVAAKPRTDAALKADAGKVERGRYLVTTSGCNDCHTPWKVGPNGPEPDYSRRLSGHPQGLEMPAAPKLPEGPWLVVAGATNTAWSGPWGVSFTANLTPDGDTGLGRWSLEQFKQTIRTGRHQGRGREILPPMPIAMYKHFTDRDLEAIFSYLRSIPPVSNRVPEPRPPAQ